MRAKILSAFYCITASLMLALGNSAYAAETTPIDTGEVVGQIVSSHNVVAPGQEFYIAASTVLNDHWHTYWSNPGDSGEPFDLTLELPDTLSAGEIIWPMPKLVPTGPIVNYGFEGSPLFPVLMKVSGDAKVGDILEIKGLAYYLVCYDICIPEQFEFTLPITVGEPVEDGRWARNIRKAIEAAPKPDDALEATARLESGVLIVDSRVTGTLGNAYIFPFDGSVAQHSEAQSSLIGERGIRTIITPSFGVEGGIKGPLKLLLAYDDISGDAPVRVGKIITAQPGAALDVGVAGGSSTATGGNGGGAKMTVITALIGAFLGGLVLNLMPCVFPVISMKALSFARHAHDDRREIRRQGWLYTAGVIVTFMLLTAVLLILKATGSQIGWGFQLQSPWMVGLLALLVFAIGLNLIGAFEFGTGMQNVGGDLVSKEGAAGSFFTGALAVVVATPCTAPFMAGAVGFALAQPAFVTIIVFMALAIGFAIPFLLLSYAPKLLAKLPKPGPWMERFKEILAFPMFGAAIWLIWVLAFQAGQTGLLKILIAMLALGFAIWLFKRGKIGKVLGVIAAVFAIATPFNITTVTASAELHSDANLPKGVWSGAKVQELQAGGQAVFVDFTAAWCVTCKVNELGALSDAKIIDAFNDSNTAFLVADWTSRNDEIALELEKYGRSGVPLYLYFAKIPAGGNTSVKGDILPQILTVGMLLDVLQGDAG